jgi:hypothetical protein
VRSGREAATFIPGKNDAPAFTIPAGGAQLPSRGHSLSVNREFRAVIVDLLTAGGVDEAIRSRT